MLRNSSTSYGAVTKSFHWLTALLIVTLIPLGIIANGMPYDTGEELANKAWMFSLHKTLGVTLFFVALARILWAISQPKPGPLHGERRAETLLAALVHWLLYASLMVVPLTGWIHHAATEGFAPIWWPLGQGLPLVPKNDSLAHTFASLHIITERVLVIAVFLHIAGAVKHHFVDKDLTLRRMLPGRVDATPSGDHPSPALPVLGAAIAYVIAVSIGASLGFFAHEEGRAAVPQLAAVETGWEVQEGSLSITVNQLGSPVTGQFEDWTAAINFSETPDADGAHGDVEVTVAIASLSLGSVTSQAVNADFLSAEAFPTAVFAARLLADGEAYVADGTLTLKGATVPLRLPFSLQIDGDVATMTGASALNRTDFKVGETYSDETSVGFAVQIDVALTALRTGG